MFCDAGENFIGGHYWVATDIFGHFPLGMVDLWDIPIRLLGGIIGCRAIFFAAGENFIGGHYWVARTLGGRKLLVVGMSRSPDIKIRTFHVPEN